MPNPTFSVFTPTHRPNYLSDAYRSLCEQTRKDWEWVLVPNGPKAYIPDALRKDPRVGSSRPTRRRPRRGLVP